jgi:ATP-binding cassette subfamily C protein CydD
MDWLNKVNNLYKSVTNVNKGGDKSPLFFPVVTLRAQFLITSPAKYAMEKTRQQELTRWLKQQSVIPAAGL